MILPNPATPSLHFGLALGGRASAALTSIH
jgi:hypothetical protein